VYKLWSSSSCSLLHPPATFSLLDPNVLLSTLFYALPLECETKFHKIQNNG
jgi:hypothetical protein